MTDLDTNGREIRCRGHAEERIDKLPKRSVSGMCWRAKGNERQSKGDHTTPDFWGVSKNGKENNLAETALIVCNTVNRVSAIVHEAYQGSREWL